MICTYEFALDRMIQELPLLFKDNCSYTWKIFNKNDVTVWGIFANHQNRQFFADDSECMKSFFKILNNYTLYNKLGLKNGCIDQFYSVYSQGYLEFNNSGVVDEEI
jgi:hypothetical protein